MHEVNVIIATKNRAHYLKERSIPSVFKQSTNQHRLIVVSDYVDVDSLVESLIYEGTAKRNIEASILQNTRSPGLSGALNTGIEYLVKQSATGYVAILDDDDEWDKDHIDSNMANISKYNLSISGLRLSINGHIKPRPLLSSLCDHAFLVGNPGWQGSNTFIELNHLVRVGGYREELMSLTDRDLAIRVLRNSATQWRLIPRWTATWHADTPGSLSSTGSTAKLEGLRVFWNMYKKDMNDDDRHLYFRRAKLLFGIDERDVRLS